MRWIAGFNTSQVQRTITSRLRPKGFFPILDFVSEAKSISQRPNIIKTIHDFPNSTVAVKLTSLGKQSAWRTEFDEIMKHAQTKGCRILIDAEDVKHQEAIDHLTKGIIKDYQWPIFRTFQMYRKDSLSNLDKHLEEFDYSYIKLVRGAYHRQDRRTGLLYDTKAETDEAYNTALKLIKTPKHKVMVATHNPISCDIGKKIPDVEFAQLLDMADPLSNRLVKEGHKVYKYCPYGPFWECVPYLQRRLYENWDILKYSI